MAPSGRPSDSLQPRVVWVEKDLQRLVTRFLTAKQADLGFIREAMLASDFETVRRLGHDLKGAGEAFGFPELSILGAKVEVAAQARDAHQIAVHTAVLERYLVRLSVRFQ